MSTSAIPGIIRVNLFSGNHYALRADRVFLSSAIQPMSFGRWGM